MTPRFSYEKTGDNFRVRDADDNRIATCWDEDNARLIVDRLNQRDELLAVCKLAVANEAKADSVGGMVDDPHLKALRAIANAARATIARAEQG